MCVNKPVLERVSENGQLNIRNYFIISDICICLKIFVVLHQKNNQALWINK
jgi:hypothetical protein